MKENNMLLNSSIKIIILSLSICTCFILMIITVVSEASIQTFSKAKLFCLYKNHKSFVHIKNFKDNMTDLVLSALMSTYMLNGLISVLFNILAIHYMGMSVALSGLIITALTMSIEMIMKKITIINPEKSILLVGPFYRHIYKSLSIFTSIINRIISFIIKYVFRFHEIPETDEAELLSIIELRGEKDKVTSDLMKNILTIKNIYADDVMTSQSDIVRIEYDKDIEKIKARILALEIDKMKSFIPLWNRKNNNYMGVINIKKFFFYLNHKQKMTLNLFKKNILEETFFIPSGTSIYNAFNLFRNNNTKKFAFVLNEYGNIVGIISLTDILEEIVGSNLFEETNEENEEKRLKEIASLNHKQKVVVLSGDASVKDLQEYFPNDFLSIETYSISDLIINNVKRIPEEGEEFIYNNISFTVLDREDNKILSVLVSSITTETQENVKN